jgi:hypothetical protein
VQTHLSNKCVLLPNEGTSGITSFSPFSAENRFGGHAPWSLFLNFLKFDILTFQKIPEKILNVLYDVLYSTAKFQNKIVCIPAYRKNKKF